MSLLSWQCSWCGSTERESDMFSWFKRKPQTPACKHKWEVWKSYSIGFAFSNNDHTIVHCMRCVQCGDLKNHRISIR